jgi:hypothetical protein
MKGEDVPACWRVRNGDRALNNDPLMQWVVHSVRLQHPKEGTAGAATKLLESNR